MTETIDVFVSRPTWVDDAFKEGLENFNTFLIKTHRLNPRTIGTTDFPTEAPLDYVIDVMSECKGMIVLGYPQIILEKGSVKGSPTSQLLLPTEWNHIEATLAYANRMPLLVIHHKGITRGVFDHGAISKFLYEVDLTNPGWVLAKEIVGAIDTWKKNVLAQQDKQGKTSQKKSPETTKPTKELEKVLVYFYKYTDSVYRQLNAIAGMFKIDEEKAQYYIDQLKELGMIEYAHYDWDTGLPCYGLTPKGRAYIVEKKLNSKK